MKKHFEDQKKSSLLKELKIKHRIEYPQEDNTNKMKNKTRLWHKH